MQYLDLYATENTFTIKGRATQFKQKKNFRVFQIPTLTTELGPVTQLCQLNQFKYVQVHQQR